MRAICVHVMCVHVSYVGVCVCICVCVYICSKELRTLQAWEELPGLVGLTQGASNVRQEEQTRHALHILKRVHMMQGTADSDTDAARPLQVRGCNTHTHTHTHTTIPWQDCQLSKLAYARR